jgi:hypothetical protein
MQGYIISLRHFFSILVILILALSQGCDCGEAIDRNDPMTIKIVYPNTTLITKGEFIVQIRDLNGIDDIEFFIINNGNTQKIGTQKGEEQTVVTKTQNFDLDAQPESFTLKVTASDMTGDKRSAEISVRKELSLPQVRFILPEKFDPAHNKIFVGKTFKTSLEGRDPKGLQELIITVDAETDAKEQEIKRCAVQSRPDERVFCEDVVDWSAADYKDGDYILSGDAISVDGKSADRKARLQITLDKTGPQIQFVRPTAGQQLNGVQEIRAIVRDQVGVSSVKFIANTKELAPPTIDQDNYFLTVDLLKIGAGTIEFEVVAEDKLGNVSSSKVSISSGCQSDADCTFKPGTRCCLLKSPANQDGSLIGQCYPVQSQEGDLCDPCTQPCGRGADGKLMGCLPGACERPPYRCRNACDLGNPNKAADRCRPKSGDQPAEYCAESDITRINKQLGSCALGDNCDVFNQTSCNIGAKPPYNNCCPENFACFPADEDANICVPEGNKGEGDTNCTWKDCEATSATHQNNNCKRGLLCTVTVDQSGKPTGPSKCTRMCRCDQMCRSGILPTQSNCPSGSFCMPLRLTNGNVPMPIGACVRP